MLIVLAGVVAYVFVRGLRAALASLRQLPRSNEDWVFY